MSVPKHIKEHAQIGFAAVNSGENAFAVPGDYATPQAAFNAIAALEQFTETAIGSTDISCTNDTRIVTGVGTTFLEEFGLGGVLSDQPTEKYISFQAGTDRIWMRVEQVNSDTELVLEMYYRGTTITNGADYQIGEPNMRTLHILNDIAYVDDSAEVIHFNATGASGGGAIDAIALNLVFHARLGARIYINIKSGLLTISDLKASPPDSPRFTADGNNSIHLETRMINPQVISGAGGIVNGPFGIFILQDGNLDGQHNTILNMARSKSMVANTIFKARSRGSDDTANTNLMQSMCGESDCEAKSIGNTYYYDASGTSGAPYMLDCLAGGANLNKAARHSYNWSGDTFNIEIPQGGTEVPNFWAVALRNLTDCDLRFENVTFSYSEYGKTPVPPASWNMFKWEDSLALTHTPNRIHLINTVLLDLPSDHTNGDADGQMFTIDTLIGDMGTKVLTDAATIAAAELSCLRGSKFTLEVTQVTDFAAPYLTGPAGTPWKFILTQDAAAGDAITWNAAFIFHTAWVDGAANERCIIDFVSDGNGNLLQEGSAANKWF